MVIKLFHFDEDFEDSLVSLSRGKEQRSPIVKPAKECKHNQKIEKGRQEDIPRAIYAGSFDPIHFGHIEIIRKASRAFGKVRVAVGMNSLKKYSFSLEERVAMVKEAVSDFEGVEVGPFQGLLVRYAFQNGIYTIVKGVRSIEDFNFEELCHEVGRSQGFGVETVLMLSDPAYVGVSSSNVKILQQDHGDIHTYVPLFVKQKLEQRLSNQYLLGVTGEIGSGKSYFGEKFVEWGRRKGISIHNIELDVLGHRILEGNKEYSHVRAQIIEEFGPNVDRVSLREKVFSSSEKLKKLEELLHKPILACFQEELYGKEGLVLINAALLSEAGLPYLSNNNCVLVRSYKNTRNDRLNQRGLRPKEIERIEHSQYSADVKEKVLKEQIEKDRYGKLWVVKNYDGSDHKKTFEEIAKYFNLLEDRK